MRTEKETLERTLEEIETVWSRNELFKGVIAGAYALWLGRENDVVDIEDLPSFLVKHEQDAEIRGFLTGALANHWKCYRPHITRFDKELLKQVALEYAPQIDRRTPIGTPQKVIELVVRILDIAPNDHVADFGTGSGAFLCRSFKCAPQAHYVGYETSPDCAAIARLRAKLLGGDIDVSVPGNLFDEPNAERFDKAFCPLTIKDRGRVLHEAGKFLSELPPSFPKLKRNVSDGWIYAMKTRSCLKDGGRAAILLPVGGVSGKPDAEIRRYLLERRLIEAVILLPRGLYEPFTDMQMALVALGKDNPEVLMIDASHMGARNRRSVELKDDDILDIVDAMHGKPQKWAAKVPWPKIVAREDMNPAHYTQDEIEFKSSTAFGDVIKEVVRGKFVGPRNGMDDAALTSPFQYLSIGSVNDGMIDEDLPYLLRFDGREERYCLRRNDIVLAKLSSAPLGDEGRRGDGARPRPGVSFKVALADPAPGRQIVVNDTLLMIRLDEGRADPWYVKAFLESEIGQTLLRRIAVGSRMQSLGIEAIKSMRIPLPPMDEQREIAERHREGMTEVLRLRRELNAAMRKRDDLSSAFAALVTSPSATGKETKTNDCLGK